MYCVSGMSVYVGLCASFVLVVKASLMTLANMGIVRF